MTDGPNSDTTGQLRARWRSGSVLRSPGTILGSMHLISIALFAVVAAALFGSLALVFSTIEAEREERRQAEHTAQVLDALNTLVASTTDGETGQRGYFITSDQRYLAPYRSGRAMYRVALARLEHDLGDDLPRAQRDTLREIERLGDHKWRELDETIAQIARGDVVGVHVRILSDEGQVAMTEFRSAVERFEVVERYRLMAARTSSATAEARVLPALLILFVMIVIALALSLWQVTRAARAESAAANAATIAEARDRADLLARELNHRVKNLFAVILAIVRMTGKSDPAAKPVVERISQRIHALVIAHDVSQGATENPVVDLAELVEAAIAPYRSDSERCDITGAPLSLDTRMAVPLGLVLHELVTNTVKYGAWSRTGGLVRVSWQARDGRARLEWEESTDGFVPPVQDSARLGFGSVLMQSSAQQLGGTIERSYAEDGIRVVIDFRLA
jgi:two-component sensor histidine kinase